MLDKHYTKIPNEFINDIANLSHKAVRLYIALRKYINEEKNGDMVFPSYTTLQKVTGLNRTSVANGIKELVKAGWIDENIEKGFNTVNKYHINSAKKYTSTESVLVQKVDSPSTKSVLEVVQKVNSNNTDLTKLNNKTDDFSFENQKDNPQEEDKQDIEDIRLVVERKTERKNLSGSNWYEFYKFVAKRQKKNPRENIDSFFDYLDGESYNYKKYVGFNVFYENWTRWIKKLKEQSGDDFLAGCVSCEIEPKTKEYVYMPKYTPRQNEV